MTFAKPYVANTSCKSKDIQKNLDFEYLQQLKCSKPCFYEVDFQEVMLPFLSLINRLRIYMYIIILSRTCITVSRVLRFIQKPFLLSIIMVKPLMADSSLKGENRTNYVKNFQSCTKQLRSNNFLPQTKVTFIG